MTNIVNHDPKESLHRRQRLAWAGVVGVGIIIVAIWIMLLPYTFTSGSQTSFLANFKQKFLGLTNNLPNNWPQLSQDLKNKTAAELIKVSLASNQQFVAEPDNLFILTPPADWQVTRTTSGSVELTASSTAISLAYPTTTSEILLNATTTTVALNNLPALMTINANQAQIVSQQDRGYLVIRAVGPQAAELIKQLLNEVKFIQD